MNEIETQIIHVLEQSEDAMDAPAVRNSIRETYGIDYPAKRVRHKLESLCNFAYLDRESRHIEGTKNYERNFYTIRQQREESEAYL